MDKGAERLLVRTLMRGDTEVELL